MNEDTRREFLRAGFWGMIGMGGGLANAVPDDILDASPVPTIQTLTNLGGALGTIVHVQGYHRPGDGGGGLFALVPLSAASRYGHRRARLALWTPSAREGARWVRIISPNEPVNAQWFGARGDATGDASKAINDAIWMAGYLGIRRTHIPAGRYHVTAPIVLSWVSGCTLTGDGPLTTILEKTGPTTASTDLSESPIDAVLIVPGNRLNPEGEERRSVDTHRVTVRGLHVHGKPAATTEAFERRHGIYVERSYGCTFENITFAHFESAFTARKLWMSTLKHLLAKHVTTFIDFSGDPQSDENAAASTSVSFQNCYCSNDVRGDAFVLRSVFYSTLQDCAADEVDGSPYVLHACKSITLLGCGFEQSQSGKGVLMTGSTATMISVKAFYPHFAEGNQPVSLVHLRADDRGRPSSATLIGCHFSNYGSPRQRKTSASPNASTAYDRIVEPNSRLVSIGTRYPSNVRKAIALPADRRGSIVDLDDAHGTIDPTPSEASPRTRKSQSLKGVPATESDGDLTSVQGSGADEAINSNFAELEAKLNAILATLED